MALFNIGMDRITKKLYTGVRNQVDSVAFLLDFTSFFQDPLVRIPSRAFFIAGISLILNCRLSSKAAFALILKIHP